jgi:hypothetical protein
MASFAGDRRYLSVAFTPGSENFFRFKDDAWAYQGSCPSSGDTAESSFHYWLNSFSQVSRFATYSYIQFFAACTVVVTCKKDGRWVSSPAGRAPRNKSLPNDAGSNLSLRRPFSGGQRNAAGVSAHRRARTTARTPGWWLASR